MTKYLSKCCGAPAQYVLCNYKEFPPELLICTMCKEACDLVPAPTFETATPEQKKELLRECVKEANQDQRDMIKQADDLEKLVISFMRDYVMGSARVDHRTYWAETPTPQDVKSIIEEAYRAGLNARRSEV